MPHCCRIETYQTKVIDKEISGQITTALPASVVDFGRILRGVFPGCSFTEKAVVLGFSRKWQMDFTIPYSAEAKAGLNSLLSVLKWTVTIEDSADESHAIYLHKIPFPSMDTSDPDAEPDWKYSKVGQLVNAAKSYGLGSGSVKSAEDLCDTKSLYWISRHVRYQGADAIIPAPLGNPNKSFDLPWFIASRLSGHLRIPVVQARSVRATGQQKSVDFELDARYNNIAGKFSITTALAGKTVIALDDIYSSGATMTDLVRAARAAGAQTVLGLTGTKTARHTRGLTPGDWYKVTQEAADGLTETSDA